MKNNKVTHDLDLKNNQDLNNIINILKCYSEILKNLNSDSHNALEGGAVAHYTVKLELEEKWI